MSEPPIVKKRGRGRPRKQHCLPELQPENLLPTIVEDHLVEPRRMLLEEDEQIHGNNSFTQVVQLNGGIDLRDIAKQEPVEQEQPKVSDVQDDEEEEPEQPFRGEEDYPAPPTSSMPFPSFINSPAVTESDEDRKARREVVTKLKKYAKEFPAISSIPVDPDAPLHVLQNQLDEVRSLIQNRTTSVLIKRTYLTSVNALETIGKKTNVAKLDGLADLMSRSAEVDEVLREIACELEIGYISPYKKLAFITLSSAYVLHTLNSRATIFKEFGDANVQPVVSEKYKDL